jgi:hypothetical protein
MRLAAEKWPFKGPITSSIYLFIESSIEAEKF